MSKFFVILFGYLILDFTDVSRHLNSTATLALISNQHLIAPFNLGMRPLTISPRSRGAGSLNLLKTMAISGVGREEIKGKMRGCGVSWRLEKTLP
jgi:hypothetical protein